MEFTAAMIAEFLGGKVDGDSSTVVNTFAKIEEGHPGALSFLANPKYEHYIYSTESSIVVVNESFAPASEVKATLIRVADAYASFAKLLELYASTKTRRKGISPKASVASDASVGQDCYIGDMAVVDSKAKIGNRVQIFPQAYIGEGVEIGDDATIYAGVKIYEGCKIGNGVILHAGCVIGADGFGFAPNADGEYDKIPQIGNVVIEDNVEIGANSCIDRATMGSTRICRGVKLDNLIQIGHNVVIGKNTVAASQVGVAGSTKIGENCMIGGQAGFAGHITIGNNVNVGSQSGIPNNVPDGVTMMGYPAMPGLAFHRSNAVFRNLPDLQKRLIALEKTVKDLQK